MRHTMKDTTAKLLRACSLTLALAGSAALVLSAAMPTPALADNGKGNGGGNGNGNGGGNGGGNGNGNGSGNSAKSEKSGGQSSSKSETSSTKSEKAASKAARSESARAPKKSKKASLADDLGLSASDLGALNAAHASPQALANASPNSRVGKIAAYKAAVMEGRELEEELAAKRAELDGLTPPDRPTADIQTDIEAADLAAAEASAQVAELEADLADAGGTDPVIEADLAAARIAAAEAEATQADLEAELAAAEDYAALSEEVGALEADLAGQPEVERSLLEAAANKPVTDAVEAAVKKLLGL